MPVFIPVIYNSMDGHELSPGNFVSLYVGTLGLGIWFVTIKIKACY